MLNEKVIEYILHMATPLFVSYKWIATMHTSDVNNKILCCILLINNEKYINFVFYKTLSNYFANFFYLLKDKRDVSTNQKWL